MRLHPLPEPTATARWPRRRPDELARRRARRSRTAPLEPERSTSRWDGGEGARAGRASAARAAAGRAPRGAGQAGRGPWSRTTRRCGRRSAPAQRSATAPSCASRRCRPSSRDVLRAAAAARRVGRGARSGCRGSPAALRAPPPEAVERCARSSRPRLRRARRARRSCAPRSTRGARASAGARADAPRQGRASTRHGVCNPGAARRS